MPLRSGYLKTKRTTSVLATTKDSWSGLGIEGGLLEGVVDYGANKEVELAREIAVAAHYNQVDLAGEPYIQHPEYVAAQQTTSKARAVAWLHDVLEDSAAYTPEVLKVAGVSDEVVEVVVLLTHVPGVPYEEYVERLRENELASRVKISDLEHNMDVTRLSILTGSAMKRVRKYHQAWRFLTDGWGRDSL